MMVEETKAEQPSKWNEADNEWLTKVHEQLRPIAKRYGKRLFQITMQVGTVNEGLSVIGAQGRGNRAIQQAIYVVTQAMNDLAIHALKESGCTVKDLSDCKLDIERMAALMQPIGPRGKIIVPN
jgi:hypothetical protein